MAEKATPAPAAAPVTDQKLNQVALWAMITGVSGLTLGWMIPLPWSLAAVILGHIGLSQIKRGVGTGRGYAIAGLATGYTGIALVLVAILGIIALVVAIGPDGVQMLLNEFEMNGGMGGFEFDGPMGPGMMNP
jgi:hypothetical protein